MECQLDIHDHMLHNTMTRLSNGDGDDNNSHPTFLHNGINMHSFESNPTNNGVQYEINMMPKITTLEPDFVPHNGLYSTSSNSYWKRKTISETWAKKKQWWLTKKIKRCFGTQKIEWRKMNYSEVNLKQGYAFNGHHWIPKHIEGRPFYKYARGNMLTLLGSFSIVIILLVGLKVSLQEANIDFNAALTGGAIIFLVSFLKVADFFSPVLSYFGLLWSDLVQRGDIIEVTPNYMSMGSNMSVTFTGCILDITPSCVSMWCTRPYDTLMSSTNIVDRFIDSNGSINNHTGLMSGLSKRNEAKTKNNSRSNLNSTDSLARHYIERDFMKIKEIIKIPTNLFASAIIIKHVSFVPIVDLQRID
jgi:hypothetical protein